MTKRATLLLISLLTVSSLTVVESAFAQSTPMFTLKFEAHPYDVPTTYGIDPYTGKNVTIQEGYHVENKSVVFTIKNQRAAYLFYNVRYKGHFGDDWTEVFSYYLKNYPVSGDDSPGDLVPQSSSLGYTTITIPAAFPHGEIDFQVQALEWHYIQVFVYDHPLAPPPLNEIGHYEERFVLKGTSSWSPTQTMTFPAILPNVALLLPPNSSFSTSVVKLNFTVDQSVSQVEYSLDGRENMTINGNTTLTDLPNGYHNVTVYATDEAGNTGASETVYFSVEVPEPFPISTIAAVSVATVAITGAGLLSYFRRRKH